MTGEILTLFLKTLFASVEHADALKPLVPKGMTMSEMALRFILAEPTVSTIIPGMRKTGHVSTNLKTSDAGILDPGLMKELEKHRWDREPKKWSQ